MIDTQVLPIDTDDLDDFALALHSLVIDMQTDGYECRAPSDDTYSLDCWITSYHTCPRCGADMHYEPFFQAEPRSYRAFRVCKGCGRMEEF